MKKMQNPWKSHVISLAAVRCTASAIVLFFSFLLILTGCPGPSVPLEAIFEIGVTTTGTGEGIAPAPTSTSNGMYADGTSFTAAATPEPGSVFTGWYASAEHGSLVSTDNPYTGKMAGFTQLYARFDLDITRYDITTWEAIGTAGWGPRIALGRLPGHFQIWNARKGSVEMDALGLVFSKPIRRNRTTLKWEPALAESWTVSPDATSITVTLRDDLFWSDGEQLTAADFVFAASVYQSVEFSANRDLSALGQPTEWNDGSKLEYTVTAAGAYGSLVEIASIEPLPKHIFGQAVDDWGMGTLNDEWDLNNLEDIVGNGPFIPVEVDPSESVTLKKNPYYFEEDANGLPLPYLSKVTFVAGDDPVELFNSGYAEICMATGDEHLGIDRVASVLEAGPSDAIVVAMNQDPDGGITDPPLSWLTTVAFRQAITHIVNRARIVTEAYSGHGSPVYSPVHSSSPYYWDGVEPGGGSAMPVYSIIDANDVLDGLEWLDLIGGDGIREDLSGRKISLTLLRPPGDPVRVAMCDIIAEEARAAGIEILVADADSNMVDSLPVAGSWEMACIKLSAYLDPAPLDSIIPSYGALHMSEPNQITPRQIDWEEPADAAWVTVMETPDDYGDGVITARATALQIIQQIWADYVPWIYVTAENVYEAYQSRLANVSSSYVHPFDGQGWRAIMARLYVE